VYVILRLLDVSCVFVGFGEGVCKTWNVSCATLEGFAIRVDLGIGEVAEMPSFTAKHTTVFADLDLRR
jgi:hypothetical protein